ncbi:hypothetical protein NSQ95_11975 [Psychrobacillus sp. FSL W7-1457]|uniref:hypothetical protein n=1 Tax=unclassified Psychrobacillus TaxID=2636677 RepID=UPI0030FB51F8
MKNDSHRERISNHCEEQNGSYRGNGKRRGAKTFRRGRALAFYEIMQTKSNSLKKQLATPELQSVNSVLVGELKAVEMLMDEFAQLFELVEVDEPSQQIRVDELEE